MEFTGERVVLDDPERQELFAEHFRRYVFAGAAIPPGGRVLDAGCGVGYGSTHLATTSAHVTGIDLATSAIAFARTRFPRNNLDFREMDVSRLDFPDASFDAVVSFEVIEHVDAETQARFVREVSRVLAPGGLFIASTPNRELYRAMHGSNPFHLAELSLSEFDSFLRHTFPSVALYGERKTRAYLTYELMLNIKSLLEQVDASQKRVSYLLTHPRSLIGLLISSVGGDRAFEAAKRLSALVGMEFQQSGSNQGGARRRSRIDDGAPDSSSASSFHQFACVRSDDFEISPHDVENAPYIIAVCRKGD